MKHSWHARGTHHASPYSCALRIVHGWSATERNNRWGTGRDRQQPQTQQARLPAHHGRDGCAHSAHLHWCTSCTRRVTANAATSRPCNPLLKSDLDQAQIMCEPHKTAILSIYFTETFAHEPEVRSSRSMPPHQSLRVSHAEAVRNKSTS